jgi:hypothetical protein
MYALVKEDSVPRLTELQTFDTVPPAEKTKLTVSLNEVYLQLRQPSRQGSLCVFLQGPKAEIVLYGEEVSLRASIDYAAILFGMEISLAEIEALLGVDALVVGLSLASMEKLVHLTCRALGTRCLRKPATLKQGSRRDRRRVLTLVHH